MRIAYRLGRRRLLTLAGRVCLALWYARSAVATEDLADEVLAAAASHAEHFDRTLLHHRAGVASREQLLAPALDRETQARAVLTSTRPVPYPTHLRTFTPRL